MLSNNEMLVMLSLQKKMNATVSPNWVDEGWPFMRAALIEAVEAVEHHGWKWWKKQEKDLPQLQMEIVDIWHFMLSHILISVGGDEKLALDSMKLMGRSNKDVVLFDGKDYDIGKMDLLSQLELFSGLCASRRVELKLFGAILSGCDMDWENLYKKYVGKNVLNIFRQDHGYKDGSYIKDWDGKEDNIHLDEVISKVDMDDAEIFSTLYSELEDRYSKVKLPKAKPKKV